MAKAKLPNGINDLLVGQIITVQTFDHSKTEGEIKIDTLIKRRGIYKGYQYNQIMEMLTFYFDGQPALDVPLKIKFVEIHKTH